MSTLRDMLIRHLALTVRDPRRSAEFYISVVGLDGEVRDEPWGCRLELDDGFTLALIRGEPLPLELAGTIHFGCPLAGREQALEVRQRLRRAGVREVDWEDADYVGVKVEDPDGYLVELSYDPAWLAPLRRSGTVPGRPAPDPPRAHFLPGLGDDCPHVRNIRNARVSRGDQMKSVLRNGVLVGAVLAAGALVIGPASAGAAKRPATSAKVVGTVKIDRTNPTVAYVLAQYRCTVADPANDPAHLWVSVKQNDAGTKDPAIAGEGSGGAGVATRWADSHRNPVVCDGKTHTSRFTVDQVEGKDGYKALRKGKAWVQFCLFDDTTPKGDGETDFGQPVSSTVWRNAR